MSDWLRYLLLILAGFIAGIVNTMAGGGSFLTLPALMYIYGLDPRLANGTNRIAILFSSAAASATFQKHGHLDRKLAVRLTLPTMLGVPFGALLAIYLPAQTFKPVFGAIFILMAILLLLNPKRLTAIQAPEHEASNLKVFPVFFLIGVYVGFIQAGMGILLLIGMSLLSTGDLLQSNAIKNLIGFLVTLAATLVFVIYGLVDWLPGILMAVGNVFGGFVGANLAIKKGNQLIFWFVITVMIVTGVNLLFF
ncbi:MAG: sulfite exporter TauE/SafE family protein [bacterium]|nr:sulfite exporter TauE/SafE family protein [bacterium]